MNQKNKEWLKSNIAIIDDLFIKYYPTIIVFICGMIIGYLIWGRN